MDKTQSALMRDMMEVPEILRHFDPRRVARWAATFQKIKKILITGEGSSRIFPAHNLISRAMKSGGDWQMYTEGARQAAEYNLNGYAVLGASNSGQSRELIDLFTQLRAQDVHCYGVTAVPGSKLTEVAHESLVLSCGKEGAVAATKSVVEQALVYQALLQGDEWKNKEKAAGLGEEILGRDVPEGIVAILAQASCIYFAGRNDGVAEELTLKANEILRQRSVYLEGTYVVHGVEEAMNDSEVLVLIEPFPSEIEKIRAVIAQGVGMKIIAVSSCETPFPTILLPRLEGFDGYLQLMAGWKLLVSAGVARGVNMDQPLRARKVGNSV